MKHFRLLLFITILLSVKTSMSQWVKHDDPFDYNFMSAGTDVSVDKKGDIYFTALQLSLDSTDKNNLDTTYSILLSKYTPAGNYIWSKRFAVGCEIINNLRVEADAAGYIYVTATLNGLKEIDLDADPNNSFIVRPTSGEQQGSMMIVKYTAEGNFLMGHLFVPREKARAILSDCKTDQNNNVYLVGYFNGEMDFEPSPNTDSIHWGGDPLDGMSFLSASTPFIAKYSPEMKLLWVKLIMPGDYKLTAQKGNIYSIDIIDSKMYCLGQFNTDRFGWNVFPQPLKATGYDGFLAVLNTETVSFEKVTQIEGDGYVAPQKIKADRKGNVYAGFYTQAGTYINFGSGTKINFNGYIGFFAKYNSDLTCLWTKHFIGPGNTLNALTTDEESNVIVAGQFSVGKITDAENSFEAENKSLQPKGELDIFFVKYDENGKLLWSRSINDVPDQTDQHGEGAYSIASDANSDIYITGYIGARTTDFISTPPYNYFVTQLYTGSEIPSSDYFLAKYDKDGNIIPGKTECVLCDTWKFNTEEKLMLSGDPTLSIINQPNPWSTETRISYYIPSDSWVRISVYDQAGRLQIVSVNKAHVKGVHTIRLNANDLTAAGVYYCIIEAGNKKVIRKIVLQK